MVAERPDGMTAAAKAAEAGKKVILLEKLGILGGTSNYSIEGFGEVGDKTHVGLGCPTTAEAMAESLTNSNPNGQAEAFVTLANNNGAAADWLRSIGAELTVAGGQTSAASSREVGEQGGTGWAIFDNSIADGVADVRHYRDLGLFVCADSIEELAEKTGINAAGLAATIEKYKGYVAAGKDEEFGRAMLNMTFDEAPFYACPMTCRVQGTFGGITINQKAEVLTAAGESIPGLYAAGECANDGTWGANPAAVNIVYGIIAAASAAEYIG